MRVAACTICRRVHLEVDDVEFALMIQPKGCDEHVVKAGGFCMAGDNVRMPGDGG